MKVWIDIDNPPQVQYLLPFRGAFNSAGAETVITARDYGSTVALLEGAGVSATVFGGLVGRGKLRKLEGLIARARDFLRLFEGQSPPDVLLAASRSSAMAAQRLGIPSFIIGDYEYANVSLYRLTGSTILHPHSIDPAVFRRRGFLRRDQLLSFRGLKEDITFSGVDIDAIEPHDLGSVPEGVARVLFRPPSETSHYYSPESRTLAHAALQWLADCGAQVIFSPRQRDQISYVDGLTWAHPPVVLEKPAPFVALLKSVDAIVCSGGTMLREAAYLGIPAYSIFQSRIGGVDRYLEHIGRAVLLRDVADLSRLVPARRGPIDVLESNPLLLNELVDMISQRITQRHRPGAARISRIA